ncbi:MAG: hypothetical protein Sapg2KO_44530 [Saprospiraceae bacterium]
MSNDKFTEEIKGLLANFEPEPPAKVWQGISFRLRFSNLLLGAGGLLILGLLSFSLLVTPEPEEPPITTIMESIILPDRIIVLIDTNFCEDGTVKLDTVYQDLPKLDDTELPTNVLADSIIASVNTWPEWDTGHEAELDTASYNIGKILFRKYCTTCHVKEKDRDLTGPSLYGVTQRRDKEWLYSFTRQSTKMIEEGDPQALTLWSEWKPTVMNNFPQLEDQELDDLYYYIEQWEESD